MSVEQILLLVTAVIAAVALTIALIAVGKLRAMGAKSVPLTGAERASHRGRACLSPGQSVPLTGAERACQQEAQVRVVEGRVLVAPTSRQLVEATMGRPLVRAATLAHGLAYALRPESRDRIRGLMRREFSGRRRQRRKVARRARRAETTSPQRSAPHLRQQAIGQQVIAKQAWLGELPASVSAHEEHR